MPATNSNSPGGLSGGYVDDDDDLCDYDAEIPDIDITIRAPALPEDNKKDTLGIDEEVKIRKNRIAVKLDEARLMSNLGMPKLRQEAPKKLKFKGKGHEYRDTARLLSYYQFWADDLYKKAKFRDTLQIIEKLGHSRSMREQRLSWIEETRRRVKLSPAGSPVDKSPGVDAPEGETESHRAFGGSHNDDDLYSLPQPRATITNPTGETRASSSGALFLLSGDDTSDDDFGVGPNDDELDALMDVERIMGSVGTSAAVRGINVDNNTVAVTALQTDDFEDEMEAMAGFGPPDW